MRRSTTNGIKWHRRVATDAGWSTWGRTRGASADGTSLVNIAVLLGKGSFAIESAALTGDEVSGFLLRHVLVAMNGNVSKDSYVEIVLAHVHQIKVYYGRGSAILTG